MTSVSRKQFESFVRDGIEAIPEKFRSIIKNVAFLVGDKPTPEQRRQNRLTQNETLLGLYEGIPRPARGEEYGGLALPDRITIFKIPIEEEARFFAKEQFSFSMRSHTKAKPVKTSEGRSPEKISNTEIRSGEPDASGDSYREELFKAEVKQLVIDTVWHEVAHHFGLDEPAVEKRERERGSY